jgi:hypothetical protein
MSRKTIDSCVAFDVEGCRCYRRQSSFYSRHGDVVADALTPLTKVGAETAAESRTRG